MFEQEQAEAFRSESESSLRSDSITSWSEEWCDELGEQILASMNRKSKNFERTLSGSFEPDTHIRSHS